VLFFIQLESRRVCLAGITPHPDQQWMEQMGRNVTMQKWGFLANSRYLLHDRDSKFCMSFRQLIEAGRVKTMPYGQEIRRDWKAEACSHD
jgi:putative transposase